MNEGREYWEEDEGIERKGRTGEKNRRGRIDGKREERRGGKGRERRERKEEKGRMRRRKSMI